MFHGAHKGEVLWGELGHARVLQVLRHPRYAGAFCFGRSRQRRHPDGHTVYVRLPPEDWTALIHDAHEAYIAWEDYEHNLQVRRDNAPAQGADRERGAPREGPALLQGLAVCAVCGERMTIRYHSYRGRQVPNYMCQRRGIEQAGPICQQIPGAALDEAIGRLLIESVTPLTLEVALAVQQELESRAAECEQLRRQEVEQARYQSDLARRRYLQVDPDNRLVADCLEADWNTALRALVQAQEHYERQRQAEAAGLTEAQRASILALAQDFPRLWNDPQTPDRERKRMTRLLIADVTLLKGTELTAQVRFQGGATHTIQMPLPKPAWMLRQTSPNVVEAIDALLDDHTDAETAEQLNGQGLTAGEGGRFRPTTVARIRMAYALPSHYARWRARGLLTLAEIAERLDVAPTTIKIWRRAGLLVAHRYDDKDQCLFEPPGPDAPKKFQPKSCKHRTLKTRKGILLSELNAECISLRSHPFHE